MTDVWTHFMDMHSGGSQKLEYSDIFIELPEDEARGVFEELFGRNPDHVTCYCCGSDFSSSESPTLEEATGYYRGCRHDGKSYVEEPDRNKELETLEDYISKPEVHVVRLADMKPVLDRMRFAEADK